MHTSDTVPNLALEEAELSSAELAELSCLHSLINVLLDEGGIALAILRVDIPQHSAACRHKERSVKCTVTAANIRPTQ